MCRPVALFSIKDGKLNSLSIVNIVVFSLVIVKPDVKEKSTFDCLQSVFS